MLAPEDLTQLRGNLERLRERIARAAEAAGRDPAGVALVAVTKYAGAAYARALVELGQLDLGENRVGHLLELAGALADAEPRPRWHMIGHLQRNKANKVADTIDVLHSLDDLRLATRLDERRDPDRPPLDVYVEVRLSDDPGRSGVSAEALPELLAGLTGLTRLRLAGLMGLPPQGQPEDARPHFRALRGLAEEFLDVSDASSPEPGLSMGMTSDLEVAIAEGATVVRVGRALLEGLSPEAVGP